MFRTLHPKDRGPHASTEVAEIINGSVGERVISSTYICQLHTGRRNNPTQRHLAALAAFFGVSPLYFFDETQTGRESVPPEPAVALSDEELRGLTPRAAGLSERALRVIRDMIENARVLEGLDPDDGQTRRGA